MVRTSDWSKTNHVGTHHQHQQTHSCHPSKIPSRSSRATQLYLAPQSTHFKVSEPQKLTGKLARLAKGANWVFHLLSHLYSSIAYALSKNKRLLTKSSAEFQNIVLAIQTNAFVTPCKDLARHPIMHPISTTSTEPCITKSSSFAPSSSLIQASNGKCLLPI